MDGTNTKGPMRFADRTRFAGYLYDRTVAPGMNQRQRLEAAILVGSWCAQLPEGASIDITHTDT